MTPSRFPVLCLLVTLACQPSAGFGAARSEEWVTRQGEKIRGAPVDVVGPYALFVTPQRGGRKVILRQLTEADCVRFHQRMGDTPQRAPRWRHSNTRLTKSLLNNVRRLEGGNLVSPQFGELPQPEFLALLFLSGSRGRSAEVVRDLIPEYQRVYTRFPGQCEAVFIGVNHSADEHNQMARELEMPWLIEDFRNSDDLDEARQLMLAEPPSLTIVTRTGVPIASSHCKTKSDIERAMLETEAMLSLMRPGDKRAWPERLYFYRTVRLASFRTGRADPMMVGHQLDLAALRVAGIKSVDATLAVSAEGEVTSASVQPAAGITVEFGNVLGETLRDSAMVPAVENGQFVDGTYLLHLEP